jgi:hypothetical protein
VDKEITIDSIKETMADGRSDAIVAPRSRILNSDKKGPTSDKRPVHPGRKEIGDEIDEGWERTNFASIAVSTVTLRCTIHTLLRAKRQTSGKCRRVKARQ